MSVQDTPTGPECRDWTNFAVEAPPSSMAEQECGDRANVAVGEPPSFAEIERLHAETQLLDGKRLPVKTTPKYAKSQQEVKRVESTQSGSEPSGPQPSGSQPSGSQPPTMDAKEVDELMKTLEND